MKIWAYDLETTDWSVPASAGAVSNEGDEWFAEGADSFAALADLMRDTGGTWVAHVGGRFDFPLLLNARRDLVDRLIVTGSTVLRADGSKRLKIRDSYPLTLASLARLGEAVGMPKMDVDRRRIAAMSPEELRAYNLSDCHILSRVIDEIRAWAESSGARPSWTAGGQAVNIWQATEPDSYRAACRHRVAVDVAHQAGAAIRGGRVECFARGVVSGPVYTYDIKSSYPARWGEGLGVGCVRVSPREAMRRMRGGRPVLARARWRSKSRGAVAWALDAGTLAGAGACEAWIGTAEFAAMDGDAAISGLHVLEAWGAEADDLEMGAQFAAWCFAEKERGVPWAKVAVNSLHGKAGEKPLNSQWTRVGVPMTALSTPAPRTVGDWTEFWSWGCDKRGRCSPHVQPIVAGTILSRARAALVGAMRRVQELGGRVYYCDTDSIHCDLPPERFPLPLSAALGAWAFEGEATDAIYLGPKSYCLIMADGKIKAACKGVDHRGLAEGVRDGDGLYRAVSSDVDSPETGDDLRVQFFREALATGARATRGGISTFASGLHLGGWGKRALTRTIRVTGRGKRFGSHGDWCYLTPSEV